MFQALVHNFRPMKTSVKTILPLAATLLVLLFAACKKKDANLGVQPIVEFTEGEGYVSRNDTVHINEIVKVGVTVDNQRGDDPLSKFYVLKVLGEEQFETVRDINIPSDKAFLYTEEFKFTFTTTGVRKYKFAVNNTHGLKTENFITFTVVE
jgi:hypothetical protein